MLIDTYYRRLALIIAVLSIIIAGTSALLYSHGPRVRVVSFSSDPAIVSFTDNTTITIRFDRPLKDDDYAEQISFTPQIAFVSQALSQTIQITLLDNFRHDTEYAMEIGPDIFDKTGRQMSGSYRQTFTTAQPSYAYLERNYGYEYDDTSLSYRDAADHIKLAALGEEPEIIFSDPEITTFVANRDYVLVATNGEEKDQLYTVDLRTREVRQEQFDFGGRLRQLTLSLRGEVALFTVTPDFNSVSPTYYESFSNRVDSLNLETGETRSLTDTDGEYLKAFSIQLDNDGQVALIQDASQSFFAVSPFNDYAPVLIGTYAASLGFFENASEIVFRDNEDFVRYDVASGESKLLDLDPNGYIQTISSKNNSLYISSSTYFEGEPRSYVSTLKGWRDADPKIAWSNSDNPGNVLRDVSVSHDGSLLALQLAPDQCTYDQVGLNAQCQLTHTVIYAPEDRTPVAEFKGFGLVWL